MIIIVFLFRSKKMIALTLNLTSTLTIDDDKLEVICQKNKTLNFERNA